jgi:hypothetical protein
LLRERGLKLRGGELALLNQQVSEAFFGDGAAPIVIERRCCDAG